MAERASLVSGDFSVYTAPGGERAWRRASPCGVPCDQRADLPRTHHFSRRWANKPPADVPDPSRWHHAGCRAVGETRVGSEEDAPVSSEEEKNMALDECCAEIMPTVL